jgi:ankyrin repeat protein
MKLFRKFGDFSTLQQIFKLYFPIRTLLELGASPNYRDSKNITPVYLSITKKNDPKVTEALLHDHAVLGTQDTQGWNEVHQVRLPTVLDLNNLSLL